MGLSDIDFEYMASLHGGGLLKEREFLAHQFTKNLDSRSSNYYVNFSNRKNYIFNSFDLICYFN